MCSRVIWRSLVISGCRSEGPELGTHHLVEPGGKVIPWFYRVQPLVFCSRLEDTCRAIHGLSVDSFNQRPMRQAHQAHGAQPKFFADDCPELSSVSHDSSLWSSF